MRDDLTEPGVAARLKSDRAVTNARRLRRTATPAEQRLWFELRRRPIDGTHFRRQTPMGPFIVDFVCHGALLAVEVDGGAHRAADVALRDAEKQAFVEGRGYRLLRFSNEAVLADAAGVARAVFAEAEARMG